MRPASPTWRTEELCPVCWKEPSGKFALPWYEDHPVEESECYVPVCQGCHDDFYWPVDLEQELPQRAPPISALKRTLLSHAAQILPTSSAPSVQVTYDSDPHATGTSMPVTAATLRSLLTSALPTAQWGYQPTKRPGS